MQPNNEWKAERIVVNVSGGKDSTATLLLALDQLPKDMVMPLFSDTKYEHSKTYKYLDYLEDQLGVKIERVSSAIHESIPALIRRRGIFPSGMRRFCTDEMKQRPSVRFLKSLPRVPTEQWLGMRANESVNRNRKYGGMSPDELLDPMLLGRTYGKTFNSWMRIRLPIVDWTTEQVFEFIHAHGLKHNPLYDEGHDRVGCFPCVLGGLNGYAAAYADPEGRAAIEQLFEIEDELNLAKAATSTVRDKDGNIDPRPVKIKPNYDRFRMKKVIEIRLAAREPVEQPADMEVATCGHCQI